MHGIPAHHAYTERELWRVVRDQYSARPPTIHRCHALTAADNRPLHRSATLQRLANRYSANRCCAISNDRTGRVKRHRHAAVGQRYTVHYQRIPCSHNVLPTDRLNLAILTSLTDAAK